LSNPERISAMEAFRVGCMGESTNLRSKTYVKTDAASWQEVEITKQKTSTAF